MAGKKRELIDIGNDKRYIQRDSAGDREDKGTWCAI